ncbi:hypothetical protein BDN70DRAFT_793741 [Pholiota conissans]|uniref:Sugar phosphate transporter domain-containing protein n=1 Tax=Pholiota conissans TaxID=109636 RepID=A0A9P5ZHD1_9AGAR|nr:hypothetical protein BDN70DRAFT_793741 [Pholiota conissans]
MNSSTSQRLQVACVVVFYMFSALVVRLLVLYLCDHFLTSLDGLCFRNKAVLNSSPEIPLTFLLLQLLMAVGLLRVSAAIWPNKITIPATDGQVAEKLLPVVSVNIIGLVFNTLCLRDVEASFFQIARGLVLPLTIIVSSCYTKATTSRLVLCSAATVTLGFMLGVVPSSSLPVHAIPSSLSLFYGVLSSLFIALHSVLIKNSLPFCNNSTIELAWWTNAGSSLLILPFVVLTGEPSKLYTLAQKNDWSWSVFLWGTFVTGLFGFLLCVAGLLSIKITSPITHMFSSAARSVLQTVLGVRIFHDSLTANRTISIFVILCGTM